MLLCPYPANPSPYTGRMPKKTTPRTFDGWLGRAIDHEADPVGGRSAIAEWTGLSLQSVNRRGRGEIPYTVRELRLIVSALQRLRPEREDISVEGIVGDALKEYGGVQRLESEVHVKPDSGRLKVSVASPSVAPGNVVELSKRRKPREGAVDFEEVLGVAENALDDPEKWADEPPSP